MHNLVRRYCYFLLGLAINSFGIAFITKSALGGLHRAGDRRPGWLQDRKRSP